MSNVVSVAKIGSLARRVRDNQKVAQIYLLGRMKIIDQSGQDILPRARKTRALLACLCLSEEPVSRTRLIGLLWDRSADAQARMSLRHALSEIKQTVNMRVPDLIDIGRETIR
ncbi:MAG: hypothetical protein JO001_00680, partial [Alphaproteobacteria bacterium]|nr:hypothetical protein [Alphaproteobacteria bacterium]